MGGVMRSRATVEVLGVVAALAAAATVWAGCLADRGATCALDSDCQVGLVCALDGVCRPPDQAAPDEADAKGGADVVADVGGAAPDGGTPDDGTQDGAAADPGPDAGGCAPPGDAWVCDGPYAKHPVTNLSLPAEGHGAARLAGLANPILEDSFAPDAQTPIHLTLWVDGTLAAGCAPHIAWVRTPDDVGEDCQPKFSDTMPVDLPGLVSLVVHEATLDPATLMVSGLLDVDEVVASMDPALRDTARGLFDLDVDTDGDGTPDRCSVLIQVSL